MEEVSAVATCRMEARQGGNANSVGGETLIRPPQGELPSTSNSAASDHQGTASQGMASILPSILVTGVEAHVTLPAVQPRRPSLCRNCNPATALYGSGELDPSP